jgi:DNA repair photolyase
MSLCYIPKGRAQEYSPYALNLYNSCDFGCRYCYNRDRFPCTGNVEPKRDVIPKLAKELEKSAPKKQVLLSFVGDPYGKAEEKYNVTRMALSLLSEHRVPTAILTKGGYRCLRDMDTFLQFSAPLKVGATLTFVREADSRKWEPNAASPVERMAALNVLHDSGIMTWASLEPVIDPEQTLRIISATHDFIDQYAVGKLNHFPHKIDWADFGNEAVQRLREYGKTFYVKADLREHITIPLTDAECDPNTITLKAGE